MIWITCTVCRCHNPVLSSLMAYRQVCMKSNTTGVTSEARPAYNSGTSEFTLVISGVHVAQSLVFCVVFCESLFDISSFFFWPLYCLSFFDLQLLIISLVSWNFSCYTSILFTWHDLPKVIATIKPTSSISSPFYWSIMYVYISISYNLSLIYQNK